MRYFVLVLFLIGLNTLCAQDITFQYVDDIKSLQQDQYGFVYLISNQSICKFDGKELHNTCLHLDTKINEALILSEDDYIVAVGNKLLRYQNQKQTHELLLDEIITSLQIHKNTILIGTFGKGLFKYAFKNNTVSKLDLNGFVNDITGLESNSYVITDTEIIKFDKELKPVKRLQLSSFLPKQIVAYSNNKLAILMNDGQIVFVNTNLDILQTHQSKNFKPHEIAGQNGLLYAIDNKFLKQWDTNAFKVLKEADFEHLIQVKSLLFTSYKNTVESINVLSAFYTIDKTFSIYSNTEQFWLGREGKITVLQNGKLLKDIIFPEAYKNTYVSSMVLHDSKIYAGTMGKGILIFDAENGKFLGVFNKLDTNLNEQNIIKLHLDNNLLWVGYLNKLKVFDINSEALYHDFTDLLKNNYLYAFYVRNKDDFFLGTSDNGLIHVQNGKPEFYFKGSSVYSIVETPSGIIFSVEGQGVFLLHNAAITKLTDQYFFRANNIYNMTYIEGNMLFAHDFGVDILDLEHKQMYYFSNETLNEPHLNSNALNTSNALIGYENGILEFSTSLLNEVHNSELLLSTPLLFDKEISEDQKSFKYDENVWTFLFETQNYIAPNQRYYKYRLTPLETEWKNTTQEKITYYNLPSGNFNFEVSSGGHRNFIPNHTKNFKFTIAKPFWMLPWFWLLSVSILLLLIYWIVKYREQQVIKKEQLKSVQIQYEYQRIKDQINPHFLFNSFNSLIGLVEENPKKASKVLEKLSTMFRTVLKYEKTEIISLYEELELTKQYFEIHKIRYQNLINLDIDPVKDAHKKFVVPFSLQLLIENAIKHNIINTQSKLDIKIVDQSGFLIVTNNLNKKNKNASSLGLGLENLIKRHEMIINKKPIIVQDQKVFTVKIPYIYE